MEQARSGWEGPDFIVPGILRTRPSDPWLPVKPPVRGKPAEAFAEAERREAADLPACLAKRDAARFVDLAPEPPQDAICFPRGAAFSAVSDFWDPVPSLRLERDLRPTADDWWHVDLPRFDPAIAVNPFVVPQRRDTVEETAEKRARWLLNLLGVSRARRPPYMRYFTELFDTYPHSRTFAALAGLVEDGISADDLRTACAFKIRFAMEPAWHLGRAYSKQDAAQPARPDSVMSWARAAKWVSLCKGDDPSGYLDEGWIDDWQELPAGSPERWSFAAYAEQRLQMIGNDILDCGFDSSLRYVPGWVREQHLPTDLKSRSRLGALALAVTGMLRKEKQKT